jgi:hypothetical protein
LGVLIRLALLLLLWEELCLRLKGAAWAASLRLPVAGGVAGSAHTCWAFSLEGVLEEREEEEEEGRWLRQGTGGAVSARSREALREVRGVVEREAAAAAAACWMLNISAGEAL